jgi:hypothetical protein
MNVPGFDFHSLQGFNPKRYSVHVNGPWCITLEFEDGEAAASISSNTIRGANMVYAAKRAALLIPARCFAMTSSQPPAEPKSTSRDCSGSRASTFTTSCRKKSRYRRPSRYGSASFLAMAQGFGLECRPLTIPGMPSEPRTCVIFRPSRLLDRTAFRDPPAKNHAVCGLALGRCGQYFSEVSAAVSRRVKPCYPAGVFHRTYIDDRSSAPCNPRSLVRFR